MEKVIVAFESDRSSWRIKEILEGSGAASCILCKTADQVKRASHKFRIAAVICGYKLADQSSESLYDDLPTDCAMLMLAGQGLLELVQERAIHRLPTPVSKAELLSAVGQILQGSGGEPGWSAPQRSQEERELILQAKRRLVEYQGMTEEQAHRFLQKKSMDSGVKLVQAARAVLERI